MFWTQVLYSRQGRKQDSIVRILVLPHALLRNGEEEARRLAGNIARPEATDDVDKFIDAKINL